MFCTVLQVLLYYINTCAGLTSSLRKFCRDHPRRKSNTSIKKRSPHQQHHTGSRNQRGLRRCGARASIIFPCFSCLYTYLPTTNTPSSLLAVLVLWCQLAKQVRNYYFVCASALPLDIFHNSIPTYVNSNIFLFLSPKYRYHLLFSFSSHFSSIFSSSILTLPLTSFLSLPAKFARSADGER